MLRQPVRQYFRQVSKYFSRNAIFLSSRLELQLQKVEADFVVTKSNMRCALVFPQTDENIKFVACIFMNEIGIRGNLLFYFVAVIKGKVANTLHQKILCTVSTMYFLVQHLVFRFIDILSYFNNLHFYNLRSVRIPYVFISLSLNETLEILI